MVKDQSSSEINDRTRANQPTLEEIQKLFLLEKWAKQDVHGFD